MNSEQSINDLLEQGRSILHAAVDEAACFQWKIRAVNCLDALLGPDHFCCVRFRDLFRETGLRGLLAGTGVLAAAREELAKIGPSPSASMSTDRARPEQADCPEN